MTSQDLRSTANTFQRPQVRTFDLGPKHRATYMADVNCGKFTNIAHLLAPSSCSFCTEAHHLVEHTPATNVLWSLTSDTKQPINLVWGFLNCPQTPDRFTKSLPHPIHTVVIFINSPCNGSQRIFEAHCPGGHRFELRKHGTRGPTDDHVAHPPFQEV